MAARRSKTSGTSEDASAGEGPPRDALHFERSLEHLEGLVEALESGDLELEKALGAFEEGVKLTRSLDEQLRSAEQRVEVLLQESGRFTTENLTGEDISSEGEES